MGDRVERAGEREKAMVIVMATRDENYVSS